MRAQAIPDLSKLRKSRRNDEHDCQSQARKIAAPRRPENLPGEQRGARFVAACRTKVKLNHRDPA